MGKTLVIKDADFSDVAVEKRTILYSRHGAIFQAVDSGISILAQNKATMFVEVTNPTNLDVDNSKYIFAEAPSDNSFGRGLQAMLRTTARDCYIYLGITIEPSSNNKRAYNKRLVIQKDGNNIYIITDLAKDNPSTVDATKFGTTARHLWVGGWDTSLSPGGQAQTSDYDVVAGSLDVVVYSGIVDYDTFLSE